MTAGTPLLLLFDVDGTLLKTGGAGSRAFDRVFAARFGVDRAFAGIVPDGKTDPRILREILTAIGHDPREVGTVMESLRRDYEAVFPQEMAAAAGARLMPGVRPLLAALTGREGVVLGLLTGNFEATARVKLAHFGLDHLFPFGAYGSDHEDRRTLVPVAVTRAETAFGRRFGLGRHVVVIGDTPLDVDCALANGATAIGVATGGADRAALAAAGAHVVLDDLGQTEAAIEAVLSAPHRPGGPAQNP